MAIAIEYFDKGFGKENAFCLMWPKDVLEEKLNKTRKQVFYTVPTAQELWNTTMYFIITSGMKQSKVYGYDICGVVISLPRYLDESLRHLIMVSIEAFNEHIQQEKPEFAIKIIDNGMSSTALYPRRLALDVSKTVNDVDKLFVCCILQLGMRRTEWTILLSKNQSAILLDSGSVDVGNLALFKEIKRILFHEKNQEKVDFDEWKTKEREKLKDWMKNVGMMYSTDVTNYEDSYDENVGISREKIMDEIKDDMNVIYENVMNSVNKVNDMLNEMKELKFGNETIDLTRIPKEEKCVQGYYYDTESRNWVLSELFKSDEKGKLDFIDTNGSTDLVMCGAAILSRMY